MKIAVDGNLLCGKKTGMGTVVHHVLLNWCSTEAASITVYVPEPLTEEYSKKLAENNIKIKVLGKSNYFKWEQVVLPRALKKDGMDVLWCPYNTAPLFAGCKTVVTINDVIYMEAPLKSAPSLYKKLGIIYRKNIVPFAARNAKSIITISQFAKNEIARFFKRESEKVKVIYISADISDKRLNTSDTASFFEKNGIECPYILGFGSLETRKNTMRLIKAYIKLPDIIKKEYQLVLFGFRGYEESEEYKLIHAKNLEKKIIVLGYVSDEEKATLYGLSKLFVFPTLSEGFGIPVLEAFVGETPVITSNVTSIPEVAGKAAVLIDPTNVSSLTTQIDRLVSDEELCNRLVTAGKEQLKKFDWRITAENILAELKAVCSE